MGVHSGLGKRWHWGNIIVDVIESCCQHCKQCKNGFHRGVAQKSYDNLTFAMFFVLGFFFVLDTLWSGWLLCVHFSVSVELGMFCGNGWTSVWYYLRLFPKVAPQTLQIVEFPIRRNQTVCFYSDKPSLLSFVHQAPPTPTVWNASFCSLFAG